LLFYFCSMQRIALLSDTHSYLDPVLEKYIATCNQVWHAGDIGTIEVSDALSAMAPLKAVYGNIDGQEIRKQHPLVHSFTCEGVKVLMIHIGGYPAHYPTSIRELIEKEKPALFICGHSHILKVMYDQQFHFLHINPGAAGLQGFHQKKTMVRFSLDQGNILDLEFIELGLKAG
jgi:putative phosphoesterase